MASMRSSRYSSKSKSSGRSARMDEIGFLSMRSKNSKEKDEIGFLSMRSKKSKE
jgi:hypothetical protein